MTLNEALNEVEAGKRNFKLDFIKTERGGEIHAAASDLPQFVFDKLSAVEIAHIAGLILTAKVVAEKEILQEVQKRLKTVVGEVRK